MTLIRKFCLHTNLLLISFTLVISTNSCNNKDNVNPGIWEPEYIGEGGNYFASSFDVTSDNGTIIAGSYLNDYEDQPGDTDRYEGWVEKLDRNGTVNWQKVYDADGSDNFHSIQKTMDGGYIISGVLIPQDYDVDEGSGNEDCEVLKLNSTGNVIWEKTFGGSNSDIINCIRQCNDGGFIMAGGSRSDDGDLKINHGDYDFWIVKLDSAGIIQWQSSVGGSGLDVATSIRQTDEGGYITSGITGSNDGDVTGNHGGEDEWIVKFNSTGKIEWQRTLGGKRDDEANCIRQSHDGGYIVAGASRSDDGDVTQNHGDEDFWIVKLEEDGTLLWQKSLGGSGNDEANSIKQSPDGNYIVAGLSTSIDGDVTGNHGKTDGWVVNLDQMGNVQWQRSLGSADWDETLSVNRTLNNNYMILGFTFNNGTFNYWLLKLTGKGEVVN